MLTDEQIRKAYSALNLHGEMTPLQITQARVFIKALFDDAQPVGYADGPNFAAEEWELDAPEPMYRRMA